ncbi:MAG TPA: hypothetical protein VIN08_05645 [Ohtaekwangia sp.]|uniref:hypothetical protein n=1 Tax=Ohtaekwangia sp. TaxID=2066019 RepID=UPI002F94A19E
MKNLEAFENFRNDQIENLELIFGGNLSETGDEKLNAESGQPQDLYDDVNKRYIFFN